MKWKVAIQKIGNDEIPKYRDFFNSRGNSAEEAAIHSLKGRIDNLDQKFYVLVAPLQHWHKTGYPMMLHRFEMEKLFPV